MRRFIELLLAVGVGALGTYSFLRKPRRQQKRHRHFLAQTSGTTVGISYDLLATVGVLLVNALHERRQPVWRSAKNHTAQFAPAVVITVTTALDAWLSEMVAFGRNFPGLSDDQVGSVVDIGTVSEKYERVTAVLLGTRLRPSADLRTLSKLRNEIVHFLPYAQNITKNTVPDWLQYLDQQDLLITASGDVDFHFSQKLCSYALAYWACKTAHEAAARFAMAARPNQFLHFVRAESFQVTAGLHAPEELHHFDIEHGITLTP